MEPLAINTAGMDFTALSMMSPVAEVAESNSRAERSALIVSFSFVGQYITSSRVIRALSLLFMAVVSSYSLSARSAFI